GAAHQASQPATARHPGVRRVGPRRAGGRAACRRAAAERHPRARPQHRVLPAERPDRRSGRPASGGRRTAPGAARRPRPSRPWRVDELPPGRRLLTDERRDPRTTVASGPVAPGWHSQDDHKALLVAAVPGGLITRDVAEELLEQASDELVITPWRSVVIPDVI